jgi:hypothetical protein
MIARGVLLRSLVLFGYAGALLYVYAAIVAPAFAYEGFEWVAPDAGGVALALTCTGVVSILYPDELSSPSRVVIAILAVLVVVPVAVVIPCTAAIRDTATWAPALVTVSWALARWISARQTTRPPLPSPSAPLFWTVFTVVSLVLVVAVAFDFGFRVEWLSFADVYSVRSDFKGIRADSSLVGRYGVNWLGNIVGPFLLIYAVAARRWVVAVPGLVLMLWIYSITGFKATLLGIALVVLVAFLVRLRARSAVWLATAFVSVVLVSAVSDQVIGSGLTSLAVRRMTLLPALLTGDYWEFFSSNPNAMLGHSVLSPWVSYAYSGDPPAVIGMAYFHSATANANANLWADGFANFGQPGVLLAGLVLGLVLRLADRLASGRAAVLTAGVMVMPAVTLANSGILTSLLTGGMVLALVLLWAVGNLSLASPPVPEGEGQVVHVDEPSLGARP